MCPQVELLRQSVGQGALNNVRRRLLESARNKEVRGIARLDDEVIAGEDEFLYKLEDEEWGVDELTMSTLELGSGAPLRGKAVRQNRPGAEELVGLRMAARAEKIHATNKAAWHYGLRIITHEVAHPHPIHPVCE